MIAPGKEKITEPFSFSNVVLSIGSLHQHPKLEVENTSSSCRPITALSIPMWYLHSHVAPTCSLISEEAHMNYHLAYGVATVALCI